MPLPGPAAMLLSFDVVEEAIAEHDQWHTQERLPERLSIPGTGAAGVVASLYRMDYALTGREVGA